MMHFALLTLLVCGCAAWHSLSAATEADPGQYQAEQAQYQQTIDYAQQPADQLPAAAPIEQPAPVAEQPALPADAPPTPTQLQWPDTADMQETTAAVAPLGDNKVLGELFEKTKQHVASMDNVVTKIVATRTELYDATFALNDRVDDFLQKTNSDIGEATEIFNKADALKD